jgi:hypothetical protein
LKVMMLLTIPRIKSAAMKTNPAVPPVKPRLELVPSILIYSKAAVISSKNRTLSIAHPQTTIRTSLLFGCGVDESCSQPDARADNSAFPCVSFDVAPAAIWTEEEN